MSNRLTTGCRFENDKDSVKELADYFADAILPENSKEIFYYQLKNQRRLPRLLLFYVSKINWE
jgi:hypothetical protein